MAYELELVHRIYSDYGFFYEIKPDPDGVGNVEISYYEDVKDKEPKQTISLTEDSVSMVIDALYQQLNDIRKKK